MSYQQLLAWIELRDLEESKASEVLQMVEPALDEIDEDDPRYDALCDIEDELLEGKVPVELLLALVRQSPPPADDELDDVERLDRDYRALAASYKPEQWRSKFYLDLKRHLAESDDEELLDCVDALRARITQVWRKYAADYESIPTRSAETEVGHRLMKDGYEGWMKALDLVETEAEDDEILLAAESAVRLLVAVGQLDRDVKMQAGSLGHNPTYQTGY